MTTFKVAPSYANANIVKVDEENKKVLISETCDRCGGSGNYIIPPFFAGTCFKCNGTGNITKWVKGYTEKEYAQYLKNLETAKARKIKAHEEKMAELDRNSEQNKKALLERFGYDTENPKIYIVAGGDTFSIKDELKEAGAKYKPVFGWFFTKETKVPDGYFLVPIDWDAVYEWMPRVKFFEIKNTAKAVVDEAISKTYTPSASEYLGDIKERLKNLEVTFTNFRPISGMYGTSIVYTFKQGENVITWITAGKGLDSDIQIGDILLLTGTVKDHKEYKGVKQTILSRCKIIKKGED